MTEITRQRLDKWLWHARVTKTRSLAQKLISAGKVRIDGSKTVSPSQAVKSGDTLTITLPNAIKILEVVGFSEKRGSFTIASQLYKDLSPPAPSTPKPTPNPYGDIKPEGKPDKRARRQAVQLKQTPEN